MICGVVVTIYLSIWNPHTLIRGSNGLRENPLENPPKVDVNGEYPPFLICYGNGRWLITQDYMMQNFNSNWCATPCKAQATLHHPQILLEMDGTNQVIIGFTMFHHIEDIVSRQAAASKTTTRVYSSAGQLNPPLVHRITPMNDDHPQNTFNTWCFPKWGYPQIIKFIQC